MSGVNKKRPRVRVRLKNRTFLNSIQVPTSNRFSVLSSNDMDTDQNQKEKKQPRITPIVITDHETNIEPIFERVKCNIKIISVGRKIYPATLEDKKTIMDGLIGAKINFFSHPENDNKTFKIILSGLPNIDTKLIEDSVNEQIKVQPTRIIMFESKSSNKLYLLHFNATQVNKKTLEKVKYVYHHVIKWLAYKPKRNGPTQCYKCLMYGHGALQCGRYTACMLCAGPHPTKECNIKPDDTNAEFKCFNCLSAKIQFNHKANDINCPFRQKYDDARKNARKNTTNQNTKNNSQQFVQAPTPKPLQASFADRLKADTATKTRAQVNNSKTHSRRSSLYASSENVNATPSNNLWTFAECSNLLFNSVERLKKCNSKLEQLKVIADLLQHACT